MIAICQSTVADWESAAACPSAAGPSVAGSLPRTGSLRRIDEIVGELLAGYALVERGEVSAPAAAPLALLPRGELALATAATS